MARKSWDTVRAWLGVEHLEDRVTPTATADYDPTRVLVSFASDAAAAAPVAFLATAPGDAGVVRIAPGVYQVNLAAGLTVPAAIQSIGRVPGVLAVQPDYVVTSTATVTPNDPGFSSDWALAAGAGINAPAGWSVTTGTGSTVVAVIDSGVNYNIPDLAANLWRNPGEVPGNGVDDDGNGIVDDVYGADFKNNDGDPMDDFGHGTGVAAIIGAVGNNGVGGVGVAWHTRIMSVKFSGSDGGGFTSDAIKAIDYAVGHGAKILNLSWGAAADDPALSAAIGRAQAAGAIVVAAAGNNAADNDTTAFYPAGYIASWNNVVSVAATDQNGNLASFSDYGAATVTLGAPGVSLPTLQLNGQATVMSGTSAAAPVVAGALALLWDAHPTWTYQQVIAKLKSSVDLTPSLAGKTQTGGRLDLAELLDAPTTAPPSPPATPPPPPVTADRSGPAVTNAVFGGAKAGTFDRVWVQFNEPINPATLTAAVVTLTGPGGAIGVSAVQAVAGKNNTEFLLLFPRAQTAAGTYTVTIGPGVKDAAGNAMNQNGNGVNGEAADKFTTSAVLGTASVPPTSPPPPVSPPPPPASPPPASTPVVGTRNYVATGLPKPILDRLTTRIDFAVTDSFTIADLNVAVDITHGRTWDLVIRIVAPNGQTVTLFNRRGGTGANLTGTVFDDQAGTPVADGVAPFDESLRPEQALSAFNAMNARGLWSVQVFDLADGFQGTVNSVTLSFTPRASTVSQSVTLPPVPTTFQALTAPDLRGATPAVQAAVLDGRGDALATLPQVPTPSAPVQQVDTVVTGPSIAPPLPWTSGGVMIGPPLGTNQDSWLVKV